MSAALILVFIIGVVLLVAGVIRAIEEDDDMNNFGGFV